ncbi:Rifampicin monooxygenase-like protein [Pleurotus pulmonarius]
MTTLTPGPRVLIVGAGPTGVSAAIALVQNGITVRIIDKNTGPQVGQRGAALQPRLFELFRLLGVVDDILAEAILLQPTVGCYVPPGVQPPSQDNVPWRAKASPDIPYPNYLLLGQDRTEAILRTYLSNRYNVQVEYGKSFRAFEQNADGVTVHLVDHGTNDSEETLMVGWLIGADGPRSAVRKSLGLSFLGETRADQNFISGEIHVTSGLNRNFSYSWGDFTKERVGLRPTERQNDTLVNFSIGGPRVPLRDLIANHQALSEYIIRKTGWVKLEFGRLVHVEHWRPNIRMADSFSKGRVFIAGDAAHVHCTSGGQGIVSCIQDVMNLCWKLALAERGLSAPGLLSTYDEERLPVIKEMLSITTATFDRVMLGKVTDQLKSSFDLRQFGVNYRWSSIVVDDAPDLSPIGTYDAVSGRPQAGDRAPEVPGLISPNMGETPTSLFRILKSFRHTILIFADSEEEAVPFVNVIQEAPAAHRQETELQLLIDRDGHAYQAYLPGEKRRAFIIRPDDHFLQQGTLRCLSSFNYNTGWIIPGHIFKCTAIVIRFAGHCACWCSLFAVKRALQTSSPPQIGWASGIPIRAICRASFLLFFSVPVYGQCGSANACVRLVLVIAVWGSIVSRHKYAVYGALQFEREETTRMALTHSY